MNNLQHTIKRDTRAAMHMAVELCEHIPSLCAFKFMFYGTARNGRGAFRTLDDRIQWLPRTKPASELLLCMMRAMLADSDRADVSHRIVRGAES